jgi:hypothetical protein
MKVNIKFKMQSWKNAEEQVRGAYCPRSRTPNGQFVVVVLGTINFTGTMAISPAQELTTMSTIQIAGYPTMAVGICPSILLGFTFFFCLLSLA